MVDLCLPHWLSENALPQAPWKKYFYDLWFINTSNMVQSGVDHGSFGTCRRCHNSMTRLLTPHRARRILLACMEPQNARWLVCLPYCNSGLLFRLHPGPTYWRFVTWVISVLLKSSVHDSYMSYFGGLWSDQGHGSPVWVPYGRTIASRKPMTMDSLISDQGCWSGMANWGCDMLVPSGGMI